MNKKFQSYSPYLIFFAWAICLRILSETPSIAGNFDHVFLYLVIYVIFVIGSALLKTQFLSIQKISLVPFLISISPIMGSEPIFENDHYRYLWEGQVFSAGLNPYLVPPADELLINISSTFRHLVGYNLFTSPYSPGAILFYSLFSFFPYRVALILLQILSALLVWWLYKLIIPGIETKFHPFIMPMMLLFLKEYVQSVHIDILCFISIYLSIVAFKFFHPTKGSILFCISLFFKLTSLLFLPAILIYLNRVKRGKLRSGLFLLFSLAVSFAVFYYTGMFHFSETNGLSAFANHWVWNGGLMLPLISVGIDPKIARYLSVFGFIFTISITYFFLFRAKKKRESNGKVLDILIFIAALGLTFFSPVANPWYAIWLIIPSIMIGNKFGILYSLFLPFTYLHFIIPEYGLLIALVTHIWFFPSLVLYFKLIPNRREERCLPNQS